MHSPTSIKDDKSSKGALNDFRRGAIVATHLTEGGDIYSLPLFPHLQAISSISRLALSFYTLVLAVALTPLLFFLIASSLIVIIPAICLALVNLGLLLQTSRDLHETRINLKNISAEDTAPIESAAELQGRVKLLALGIAASISTVIIGTMIAVPGIIAFNWGAIILSALGFVTYAMSLLISGPSIRKFTTACSKEVKQALLKPGVAVDHTVTRLKEFFDQNANDGKNYFLCAYVFSPLRADNKYDLFHKMCDLSPWKIYEKFIPSYDVPYYPKSLHGQAKEISDKFFSDFFEQTSNINCTFLVNKETLSSWASAAGMAINCTANDKEAFSLAREFSAIMAERTKRATEIMDRGLRENYRNHQKLIEDIRARYTCTWNNLDKEEFLSIRNKLMDLKKEISKHNPTRPVIDDTIAAQVSLEYQLYGGKEKYDEILNDINNINQMHLKNMTELHKELDSEISAKVHALAAKKIGCNIPGPILYVPDIKKNKVALI